MICGRGLALKEVRRVCLEAVARVVVNEELDRSRIRICPSLQDNTSTHQIVGQLNTEDVGDVNHGLVLGIILGWRSNVRLDPVQLLVLALGRALVTDGYKMRLTLVFSYGAPAQWGTHLERSARRKT